MSITCTALGAVCASRLLHDMMGDVSVYYQKCAGSWGWAMFASSLVGTYPLVYLLLHRVSAEEDAWIGERGLGLFVSICGREVKNENIRLRRNSQILEEKRD